MKTLKAMLTGVLGALCITLSCFTTAAFADENLLYEEKDSQTLTRGVTYDEITRVTKNGWQYIYVLTLDAKDENVGLDVIESTREFGLKENTLAISKENNVVAAVNGDYFGSGNPQSSMGQVLSDGKLEESKNYYNADANNYAGFFIDSDGIPFVDYLKTSVGFYNSSQTIIELGGKNKYTNFAQPVYFDKTAMTTTADLDKRYKNLTKIVVEKGKIAKISSPGETVTIPDNGYIIVMSNAVREQKISYYSVGQAVSFVENGTFVFRPAKQMSSIDFGISGGGEILRNGQPIAQGEIISPSSRNPRTCIGVSSDKGKIIIMCVDGRKKGIGATSYECSAIMKELGAYDAIQLDGGGSTTMVIKPQGETELKTVNTPSDGAMREVPNAVGVKSLGTSSGLAVIEVSTSAKNNVLVNGLDYNLSCSGFDDMYNSYYLKPEAISYTVEGVEGSFSGSSFTPTSEGMGKIIAHYPLSDGGEVAGEADIIVLPGISMINAEASTKQIDVGMATEIVVNEYNKDGFGGRRVDHSLVSFSVDNPEIGYVNELGNFVATGKGQAYITCTYNNMSCVCGVYVGKTTQVINNFEGALKLQFLKFPEKGAFTGETGIGYGVGTSGKASLRLSYNFLPNVSSVQVAYASFTDRIPISGTPTELGLNVKGNNSKNPVKINIRDANEKSYNITLTDSLDFDGWQHLSGKVPGEVRYPISVMSVYTAALSTGASGSSGTLYFDDLSADIGSYTQKVTISDSKRISNAPADTSSLYIVSKGVNGAALGLDGLVTSWYSNYTTAGNENISIVNLTTEDGTILRSNNTQLRYFADYVNRLSSKNIVVMTKSDMYATGSGKFADDREKEIFHKILSEQFLKGKNIIVVSYGGSLSSANIKDGIRYINIGGTSSTKPVLTIKYNGSDMYYGF